MFTADEIAQLATAVVNREDETARQQRIKDRAQLLHELLEKDELTFPGDHEETAEHVVAVLEEAGYTVTVSRHSPSNFLMPKLADFFIVTVTKKQP